MGPCDHSSSRRQQHRRHRRHAYGQGHERVYGGSYNAGCIYAPADWIKRNPNTTQVVNAMVRAVVWLKRASVDDIIET